MPARSSSSSSSLSPRHKVKRHKVKRHEQPSLEDTSGNLSQANLERWMKMQDSFSGDQGALAGFYAQLESLPKAGVINRFSDPSDDEDAVMADHSAEDAAQRRASPAMDSEQQARAL